MSPTRQLRYKPSAIRLSSLLAYLSVFAVCVGLIEWLLSRTTTSIASLPKLTKTTASSSHTTTSLDKRYLTTVTTYPGMDCASYYDINCQPASVYDYELAWLRYTYHQYCNAFSTNFQPYAKSMPPGLTAAFSQWSTLASQNSVLYKKIYKTSRVCSNPTSACDAAYMMVTNSAHSGTLIPYPVTVGCSSSWTMANPGCDFGGWIALINQTSLSTHSYGVCGASIIEQMVITTDIDDNGDDGAKAGLLTYAPLTHTTSATMVLTSGIDIIGDVYQPSASSVPSIIPPTTLGSSQVTPTLTVISKSWTTVIGPSIASSSFENLSTYRPLALSSDFEFYQAGSTSSASTGRQSSPANSTKALSRISNSITSAPSVPSISMAAASVTTSSGNHTTKAIFHLASNEVAVKTIFTPTSYFVALFLPPIVMVFIKSYWEMVAASLKMIEPFVRLQSTVDSTAQFSILAQYLSSIVSLDAFRALGRGRLLPIWTTVMYLLLEVAAPIASASMTARARSKCRVDGLLRPCNPIWIVYPPLIRAVEAILVMCMVLIICIIWSTRKSRITVASNPSSIASLGVLLNYEPLIQLLREIDSEADDSAFGAALEEHLFRLDNHRIASPRSSQSLYRAGIVSYHSFKDLDSLNSKDVEKRCFRRSSSVIYMPIQGQDGRYVVSRRRSIWDKLSNAKAREQTLAYLHTVTTSALLSFIAGYFWDNRTDGWNNFLNSQGIGPKLIFVGLAVIVDIQMKNLERIVRVTEPLRRMALRNARAETTILLPLNGTCWSNLPRCLYLLFRYEFSQGRMLWQTVVSIVTALSDFNIIAVAGVLFVQGQTTFSYRFCVYSSLTLTACILVTVLVNTLWWMRVKVIKEIPRQPDTIGTVLSYLCGSQLIKDWNDNPDLRMEMLSAGERDALIRSTGRRYCFGRMVGIDEKERWCIDYERQHCEIDKAVQVADVWETMPISPPISSQIPRRKPLSQQSVADMAGSQVPQFI